MSEQETLVSPTATHPVAAMRIRRLPPAPALTCLLADSSRFNRRRLVKTAMRAGMTIEFVEAATAAEAREKLSENRYALVLIAATLPDENGPVLAREILAAAPRRKTQVILLADDGDGALADEAMAAGYAECLVIERLTPETLERTLSRVRLSGMAAKTSRRLRNWPTLSAQRPSAPMVSAAACSGGSWRAQSRSRASGCRG